MPDNRAHVPCGTCTACCHGQLVTLQPGEDRTAYDVAEVVDPLTGRPVFALRQQPNGDCTYFREERCSIYDRAPMVCRAFDCRKHVMAWAPDRASRRRLIAESKRDPVIMAGVERLGTLTDDERSEARKMALSR